MQPQVDTIGQGRGGQAGDQCISDREAGTTRVTDAVYGITPHQFEAVPERFRRAFATEKVLYINAIDHHAAEQQHAVRWALQVFEMLAQPAPVVLVDFQCAASLRTAGQVRVIVRG